MNLANRLAAVETKLTDQAVSSTSTHPHTTLPQEQLVFPNKTPFKMEIPCFNGSDRLGWILKFITSLISTTPKKNSIFQVHLFKWTSTKLVVVDV